MFTRIRQFFAPDDGAPGGADPAPVQPAPAAAPEAAPAAPVQASTAAPARPKWMDQLPKGRAIPEAYNSLDTLDKLIAHAEEADERLSRAIVRPGKDAKPEDIKDFLEKQGIPMKPEDYALKADAIKVPNADKFVEGLAAALHKKGLSKDQATGVYEIITGILKAGETAQVQASQAQDEAFKTGFLALYGGDEAKANTGIKLAENFMAKRLGSKEAIQALAARGALKDPAVVQAFANLEERVFTDPKFIVGKGGGKPAPAGQFGNDYSDAFNQAYGG
jgi:hypothetical protein